MEGELDRNYGWQPQTAFSHAEAIRANIAQDTDRRLMPAYEVVQRRVGQLACGDLVIEPVLGEVRVVQVAELGNDNERRQPLLQVHMVHGDGLSAAARTLPADATLPVRVPALMDRALIRRGIDLAAYNRREVDDRTARTIAAQLQRGPASALYAFAVSGVISDRLYDELDEVALAQSPVTRRWIDALARYCLSREGRGPVAGWAAEGW